jgi:hypothetical protein
VPGCNGRCRLRRARPIAAGEAITPARRLVSGLAVERSGTVASSDPMTPAKAAEFWAAVDSGNNRLQFDSADRLVSRTVRIGCSC